ncbi:MAG: hypothetical protein JSW39_08300 [Desulfobacterales bacterium]|nr:MAG: hypothetical protein JSW39_08300 [Desulfobacterales bacterium]
MGVARPAATGAGGRETLLKAARLRALTAQDDPAAAQLRQPVRQDFVCDV